jgi:hypothetical protein
MIGRHVGGVHGLVAGVVSLDLRPSMAPNRRNRRRFNRDAAGKSNIHLGRVDNCLHG